MAGSGDVALNFSGLDKQPKSTGLDASGQQLIPTKVVGELNPPYTIMPPEEMITMVAFVALILVALKRVETNENENVIKLLALGLFLYVAARVFYAHVCERGPERRKRIAALLLNTYTIGLFFGLSGLFHPLLIAISFLLASIYALIAYRMGAFE